MQRLRESSMSTSSSVLLIIYLRVHQAARKDPGDLFVYFVICVKSPWPADRFLPVILPLNLPSLACDSLRAALSTQRQARVWCLVQRIDRRISDDQAPGLMIRQVSGCPLCDELPVEATKAHACSP